MGRPILVATGAGFRDVNLVSSGGLFLLSVILLSISLISMVIFACGDSGDPQKKRYNGGGGGCGGGGCGGGGCGGCGGG